MSETKRPKTPQWTASQQEAITFRGGDVLVSASAGTGKTAVLCQRCISLVHGGNRPDTPPADIHSILVVTFTDAAAQEMRSRIHQALAEAAGFAPCPHLKRQLLLLDAAQISTMHSFCKRLISEYFYRLGIDPAFAQLDGDQQMLVQHEVLEEVVERAWQTPAVAEGLCSLLQYRNLRHGSLGFLDVIVEVSNFLDSIPDADLWIENARTLGMGESVHNCEEILAGQLLERLSDLQGQIELAAAMDRMCLGGYMASQIEEMAAQIEQAASALEDKDVVRFRRVVEAFSLKRLPPFRDKSLLETRDWIKQTYTEPIKMSFRALTEILPERNEYTDLLSRYAGRQRLTLLQLIKDFRYSWQAKKQSLGAMDFADLQRHALRLLRECPDVCENLRRRFGYIFVDEAQDINALQYEIINQLRSTGNVFLVGDIKQSIYGFRQADPGLFLEQLEAIPAARGRAIHLSDNFRSHPAVLNFVNAVFSRTMSRAFGEVDYDEKAALWPGLDVYPDEADNEHSPRIELHLIDEDQSRDNEAAGEDDHDEEAQELGEDTGSVLEASHRQAALIAQRIRQMVEEEKPQIYDKKSGGFRPVEYRDIVVLMRSPSRDASEYVQLLQEAEIPVETAGAAGFFETTEITDMLCLLKVLDNPQRDIELAGLLRSPVFGFSDSQLLTIRRGANRGQNRNPGFWDCVQRYCRSGPKDTICKRLIEALEKIEAWRQKARSSSVAEMLWEVLRSSGYLSFVLTLRHGRQRRANLLKLHERAIEFEHFSTSRRSTSLGRFVKFLEKLREKERDWAPAEPDSASHNAVRVMSVHKSKGLEFPVVILAQLGKQFNLRDVSRPVVLDKELGIGLSYRDPDDQTERKDMIHTLIAHKKKKAALFEEMRILYVALTRARERLILTGAVKNSKVLQVVRETLVRKQPQVTACQLRRCRTPIEWILYGLGNRPELLEQYRAEYEPFGGFSPREDKGLFRMQWHHVEALNSIAERWVLPRSPVGTKPLQGIEADPQLLVRLEDSLSWHYAHEISAQTPAKTSVTRLTHEGDESYRPAEGLDIFSRAPSVLAVPAVDTGKARPGGAELGSAVHLVMEHLPLEAAIGKETIERTIRELTERGLINVRTAQHVPIDTILHFFDSPPGKTMLTHANRVFREWQFTWALPLENEGDFQIIQGIIDVLIETPDGIVILDFKTDRCRGQELDRRIAIYSEQIRLYSRAAEAIVKMPVKSRQLCFISLGHIVDVN